MTDIDSVGGPSAEEQDKEKTYKVYLHAFCGDRDPAFLQSFKQRIKKGEFINRFECLIYTGHVGISFAAPDMPIFGFNPNPDTNKIDIIFDTLKQGGAYPGKVSCDTQAFEMAKERGIEVKVSENSFSESEYNEIRRLFLEELHKSKYRYSFPGGKGDCNCATWPAKINIPIPTSDGNMKKYMENIK